MELVGDDLFVTNVKYIQRGIDERLANAALIKLNQIGTLSETFAAVQLCQANGWGTFISHRSGETVDSFIADMTVAMRAGHLKTGAPSRGERIEKIQSADAHRRPVGRRGGCMPGVPPLNAAKLLPAGPAMRRPVFRPWLWHSPATPDSNKVSRVVNKVSCCSFSVAIISSISASRSSTPRINPSS